MGRLWVANGNCQLTEHGLNRPLQRVLIGQARDLADLVRNNLDL
jgi:hypothetical protein